MIYRTLNIGVREPHQKNRKPGLNSDIPEGQTPPASAFRIQRLKIHVR